MEYIFETKMQVRDYECDIEGIVNNANYLHYTEHTRHLFTDAVVARMNLQYKVPLRCDDEFFSRLALRKEGLRYVFFHDIYRASDGKLCFKSTVEVVCLVGGRLAVSPDYDRALAKYI